MLNILIPVGGKSVFFDGDEYPYPKPLIEINGKPMIQLVIESFQKIKENKRFIFIVNQIDCDKYHLDNVLNLLTDGSGYIIRQPTINTKGAVCSALMAIDYIDNESKLVIANGDQIIDEDLDAVLESFNKVDAGVICFESVHPKWSYARIDENGNIIETAEKRPISKNAIAGFYYFNKGSDFVRAAMKSIEKDANVNGLYFIAPTLNELILENRNLVIYKIKNNRYKSFYSPQKIKEYEAQLNNLELLEEIR